MAPPFKGRLGFRGGGWSLTEGRGLSEGGWAWSGGDVGVAKGGSGRGLLVQHPATAVEVAESFGKGQLCIEAITQSHKEALGVRPGG